MKKLLFIGMALMLGVATSQAAKTEDAINKGAEYLLS